MSSRDKKDKDKNKRRNPPRPVAADATRVAVQPRGQSTARGLFDFLLGTEQAAEIEQMRQSAPQREENFFMAAVRAVVPDLADDIAGVLEGTRERVRAAGERVAATGANPQVGRVIARTLLDPMTYVGDGPAASVPAAALRSVARSPMDDAVTDVIAAGARERHRVSEAMRPIRPEPVGYIAPEAPVFRPRERGMAGDNVGVQFGSPIKWGGEGIGAVPMNANVDYMGFTLMIPPEDFLRLAPRESMRDASLSHLEKAARAGEEIGNPFLMIDFSGDVPKVVGHEGRHRASVAAKLAAGEPIPVHVFPRDAGEMRARHVTPEHIEKLLRGVMSQPRPGGQGTIVRPRVSEYVLNKERVPVGGAAGDNVGVRFRGMPEGGAAGDNVGTPGEAAERRFADESGVGTLQKRTETPAPRQVRRGTELPPDPRTIPLEEALELARSGAHLRRIGQGGPISGAPEWVTGPSDLNKLRARMDEAVFKGAVGRDWYDRQRAAIVEMVGREPTKQELTAAIHALFSPQASPRSETLFSLRVQNAHAAGAPIPSTRTRMQLETAESLLDQGRVPRGPIRDVPGFGPKTTPYYEASNPVQPNTGLAPHDVWDRRVMGYQRADAGQGEAQRIFSDYEQLLAADRFGLRPQEIQAAMWTSVKADDLMSTGKYKSYDDALQEARKSIAEALPEFTAHEPIEFMPGKSSGHLPDLASDPELRAAFEAENPWLFGDRDALYDAAGLQQRLPKQAQGVYTNEAGELELNAAAAGRPLLTPKTGNMGVVSEPDAALMDAVAATRGYVGVQEGSPWSFLHPGGTRKGERVEKVALQFPVSGRVTPEEMARLNEVFGKRGMWVSDGGDRILAGPFDPSAPQLGARELAGSGVQDEVAGILGDRAGPVDFQGVLGGNYIGYDWSQPGTGTATRQFLAQLEQAQQGAPAVTRMFDDPRVQAAIERVHRRDARFGPRAGGARPDIQTARSILREGGPDALRRALEAGVPLPALVGGGLLGGALAGEDPWEPRGLFD